MSEYDTIKEKLEKEFDVQPGEKADKLFWLAWEWGHSSGESEIRNYYVDMLPLIK